MEQPNDEMSLELRLSHSFKHQISVKVLSYFWFLKRRCCGFFHLPFTAFGKLESFQFLFQNFGKHFRKLEKLFSKNWRTILETYQFSKIWKRQMIEACVPKFILDA